MQLTSSLDSLHDAQHRKILDLVDNLRRIGLKDTLSLPQIVVCGDQSAGKSSVLEAISEIPFPRKEDFCTRFATEVILRRTEAASVSVRIVPDKMQPEDAQKRLKGFLRTITDISELPTIIDEATLEMGLGSDVVSGGKGIARDVLSVEISGPQHPQLTLVDLPGLVHTDNKYQSEGDVEMIHSLVKDYISEPRTIILAIISAKNDYAGQGILKYCRQYDPRGQRTLGIITKPDQLEAGSGNEKSFFELARNESIPIELGWHMLKNRKDGINSSFADRNHDEQTFFSQGNYRTLDPEMLGIEKLRTRLSKLLQKHLRKELPSLKKELDEKLSDTSDELENLGEKRSTVPEQRKYLTMLSTQASAIFDRAVKGIYEDDFFGRIETAEAVSSANNIRRLRAVIQFLNLKFAFGMRKYGRKFSFSASPAQTGAAGFETGVISDKSTKASKKVPMPSSPFRLDSERSEESDEDSDLGNDIQEIVEAFGDDAIKPKKLSRDEAVNWVLRLLQRTRGRELPGNFNPLLISQIFWEQSEPWAQLAYEHIEDVAATCKEFVDKVLAHVAAPEACTRLLDIRLHPALKRAVKESQAELAKIVDDKNGHPITYNHYYTSTIQKMRQDRQSKAMSKAVDSAKVFDFDGEEAIDPKKLESVVNRYVEADMDRFSANEALDCQAAFYKDETKYFINAVTKQVVERHLVATLTTSVLSPMVVLELSDDEVSYIAAEPADVTRQRDFLDDRIKMLKEAKSAFRTAMTELR